MAGRTLIDGVYKRIKGGNVLEDGVSKKIKCGKVLIDGIERTISFPVPIPVTITTSSGLHYDKKYAYVVYNGKNHYPGETLTIESWDVVKVVVKASKAKSGISTRMNIKLNGETVVSGTKDTSEISYDYTPSANATSVTINLVNAQALQGIAYRAEITGNDAGVEK